MVDTFPRGKRGNMDQNTTERFDYASEIWNIANLLYGTGIARSDYHKVILPFTMLRRLECALEPTRDAVLAAVKEHETDWGLDNDNYCASSKKAFYNVTSFRLSSLGSTDTFDALMQYVNGFSPNARDIFTNFGIENTARELDSLDLLYSICRKFITFDLSPDKVSDREMSNIYEHLIQKFGEAIAENAEDFMTPKDVVRLAVGMVFANDEELMNSDTGIVRTIYDPTMGTSGFLSDAMDQLEEWHHDRKMVAPAVIVPYGQEVVKATYATGKTAMMLRNVSDSAKDIYDTIKDLSAHIAREDTLSADQFPYDKFDYILSNPPYGKSWKAEEEDVKDEAKLGFRGRFGAGLPSIDDGSMLFLQHVVSKMKRADEGGSRAGIVLSASPLFTGDAGSGPSNIRRWLFEQDVIDCIVKLPDQIFYRTGINTYLWILNSNKPEGRKGMIQLIDASGLKTSLRKNQGNKRYEISEEDRKWIIQTYIDGHDHGNSVLVPAETFMYRKVATQRPLRAILRLSDVNVTALLSSDALKKLSDNNKAILKDFITSYVEAVHKNDLLYEQAEFVAKNARTEMYNPELGVTAIADAIRKTCVERGESYPLVKDKKNNIVPDPDLKDSENIPFDTSFEKYLETEVLPFAPETWIDESVLDKGPLQDGQVGVVGTNISFNRFFYHYEEPRKPEDIATEIRSLEKSLGGFMEGLLE